MNTTNVEEDDIDIRELFVKIKRNILRILFIMILLGSGTMLYLYFVPVIYSSNVTMSLDSQKDSSLEPMFSKDLSKVIPVDERVELAKVTLTSKKFIGMIIHKIKKDKAFFIRKNFKKNEVNDFPNLKIDINYKNTKLNGDFFEIIPQNDKDFLLKIVALNYSKTHQYNSQIKTEWFNLRVATKKGENPFLNSYEEDIYTYISSKSWLSGLMSFFHLIDNRAYIFKSYNKSLQEDLIIENMLVTSPSSTILEIVYTDTLPKRAQRVVQTIADSYIQYNVRKTTSKLEQTLNFLDKQLLDIKQNLKTKGNTLKKHQQKNGTTPSITSSSQLLTSIENKNELIKQITLQLQETYTFQKNLDKDLLSTVSLVSSEIDTSSIQSLIERYRKNDRELRTLRFQHNNISKSVTSNDQIIAMINELKEAQILQEKLLHNLTNEHPEVIEQQAKISIIEDRLDTTLMANIEKLQEDKVITKATILNNILIAQKKLNNKLKQLKKDVRTKNTLLKSLPAKILVNQGLQRNFELSEDMYTLLLKKKIEVEISKASIIANANIIKDAQLPRNPLKPKKRMILLISLICGFILGIIYTSLKEYLDTTIHTAKDIEKLTAIPIYGTLPTQNIGWLFKEGLRNIRTNLEFTLSLNKDCKTILISSMVEGEGKTTITAGLGDIIAQANKKVLLIDLDLRKPRLHKELEKPNEVGISDCLSGNIEYEELIIEINENLHFISAGSIPLNPSELLMSKKFEEAMIELKNQYDYILFDTSPIGSVIDANMLLKYSNLVLLVVRSNKSEKNYLTYFKKIIKEKNIQLSGIILNGVKHHKNDVYSYGYGYRD